MLNKIQKWLENPKRDYHEGVRLFAELASPSAKAQFLAFFSNIGEGEKVDQFDSRFTILVNQMAFVKIRLQSNKEAFKNAVNAQPMINAGGSAEGTSEGDTGTGKRSVSSGALKLQELPKQFDKDRARLTELVPLMANIHADMAVETITDEARKALADELVKLDLERRSIWDKIDNTLAADGQELDPGEKVNDYSENEVIRGAQMAARITRLKENIKSNEKAIETNAKKGKPHLVENAKRRLEKYSNELAELEAALKDPDEK